MVRTVTCSCGYVLRAKSDEELYALVRRHIIPMDRERHYPVQTIHVTERVVGQPRLAAQRRHAHA